MTGRAAKGVLPALLALAVCACGDDGARLDEAIDAAPAEAKAKKQDPRDHGVVFVGVIDAADSVDLAPKMLGELVDVHVRAGDEVQSGALIATLDDEPAREALEMARAELRAAQAAAAQAAADTRASRRQLDSEKRLYSSGYSAGSSLSDATSAHQRASAASSRAAADIAERRARLASLERQLGETGLRAPFSGTIAVRYKNPGELVGPNQPVVRLISTGVLLAKFAAPPADARLLSVGDPVIVEVDGVDGEGIPASVQQIAPEIDPATGLVFFEARLEGQTSQLRGLKPRSPAWVRPALAEHKRSPAVAAALAERAAEERSEVRVVAPEGADGGPAGSPTAEAGGEVLDEFGLPVTADADVVTGEVVAPATEAGDPGPGARPEVADGLATATDGPAADEPAGVVDPLTAFRERRARAEDDEPAAEPARKRTRPRKERRARKASRAESSGGGGGGDGTGTVDIGSKPPCKIIINGRDTGLTTPHRGIRLPAGKHTIELRNDSLGIRKRATVRIRAGKSTKLIRDFTRERR